jgi:hypothetical protein
MMDRVKCEKLNFDHENKYMKKERNKQAKLFKTLPVERLKRVNFLVFGPAESNTKNKLRCVHKINFYFYFTCKTITD